MVEQIQAGTQIQLVFRSIPISR